MAKMRLPNGVEIILSTEEVLDIIGKYGSSNSSTPATSESKSSNEDQTDSPTAKMDKQAVFTDEYLEKEFSVEGLVKSIKEKGKPFSYSLREEQIKRLGTYFTPRSNQHIYGIIYRAFENAKREISKEHPGKWVTKIEAKGRIKSSRCTLVENNEQKTTEITEEKSEEMKQPSLFDIEQ